MKKILIALVMTAAFALTSCGLGPVTEGEVIEKEYKPAKKWTEKVKDYDTKCKSSTKRVNGKTKTVRDCKKVFDGYDKVKRSRKACYQVEFKNKDGDEGEDCVSKDKYDSLEIGDWYKM